MANEYYERLSEMNPGDLADGLAMEAEFDAISQAFSKLPAPHTGGQGFDGPVRVGDAVNTDEAVSLGQLNAAIGEAVLLPIATYGNLNATAWEALPSNTYLLFGTGAQFSNTPYTLVAGSTYYLQVRHVIGGSGVSVYHDQVSLASTDDTSNIDLRRLFMRTGATFVGAVSGGWVGFSLKKAAITALESLTPTADRLAYYTGSGAAALTTLTIFARTLLDDADASTMRSTLGLGDTESGSGTLMRVGGATILDAERYALERATGGSQTIIRDSAGNANAMFVLPRFSYADLGMTADMGTGDVTAFDFGSGSIKSEIFIGAYLASGSGAVSAPRQDPRSALDHSAARAACAAKGAGWHLMTAHEWAAIALWCMANGYEPIGNTNWGRSHAKTWRVGDRADNYTPGDASGIGRTQTGSIGVESSHDSTLGGIFDLVGNVWEWQDGFLLQDGRFKLSSHNTQIEAAWAFAAAFLDASTPTGGSVILSNAVNNRLGAIGDNANAGNSANAEWRAMTKSGSYVSNQAMKRLLLEPAGALPQGRIYMRNFGERLPFRGGTWNGGTYAGLAALNLYNSRAVTDASIGFRPAFA